MKRSFLAAVWAAILCVVCVCAAETPQPETITLERAVSEAVANNLGLLAERANISIAEARLLTASLRPNPVMSVGGDHLDLLGTGFNDFNGGGPTEYNLRTDFIVERGGKRQARVAVARAARSVAESQLANVTRMLVLDVATAFVDLLAAREQAALARESLSFLNEIVTVNTARVKAGDLAEVELSRSQLAALQFENTLRVAELRERNAGLRLATLIGRRGAVVLRAEGDARRDPEPGPEADWEREALERRPDVEALRRDVERAAAEVRSQTAQRRMDWTLGTEYRRQTVSAQANALGFFFSVPLAVYNRNQGEIARAGHEERQARLRLGALEAAVRGEVAAAHNQCLTARGLLENAERRMLEKARDVRQITEYRYRRGEASLLELLDAQRAFNETMQSYQDARAEYARSLYLLDSAAGRNITK